MKVLVTGNKGFIGRHLERRFRECVWEVSGFDNAFDGFLPSLDGVDCIVHAGAHADISANWTPGTPDSIFADNIKSTFELAEAARRNRCRIVFLSTAAVYGNPADNGGRPHTEEDAPRATSPYAASKLAGEAMMQVWLPGRYHNLRLAAAVGAGYRHGHIADFARQALAGGKISPKSNGLTSRSYVHVDDVVNAVEMCIVGFIPGGTYNVASGSWSCRDTARAMGLRDVSWPLTESAWLGDYPFLISSQRLRSFGWVSK